jgi:hypothetical protein
LGDEYFRRADGELVAYADFVFEKAFGCEIFPEAARREIAIGEFPFPVGVVLDGVAVDGFVFAAVDGQIGLAVAVQVEFAERYGAFDRLLEDTSGYGVAVPDYLAGTSDV